MTSFRFFLLALAACSSASDEIVVAPVPNDAGSPGVVSPPADGGVDASSPCAWTDLRERLLCIPGIKSAEEVLTDADAGVTVPDGYRRFELTIEQPTNHDDPTSGTFTQRLSLLHHGESEPMVLASSGYGLSRGRTEITQTFRANQIQVEHRFFTPSGPNPPIWQDLDIRQSAADYHHIVMALKTVYAGHWVNTGASKGGMTSIYHRRFYPQDVDGTVAYVAPNVYGTEDARFVDFLKQVGGPAYAECRDKLVALQQAVLANRAGMEARMKGTYVELGGKDVAFEHAVLELPFAFWQYSNPTSTKSGCSAIPSSTASVDDLFAFFDGANSFSDYSDDDFAYYAPYYYQAATQLGAPAADDTAIVDLLAHRATYTVATYAPKNVPIAFDAAAMPDIASWVSTQGTRIIFVYGEFDPWSAGRFDLGAATDSYRFIAAGRNHGAVLGQLTSAEQQTAVETLERWLDAKVPSFGPGGQKRFVGGDELEPKRRPRL